MRMSAASVRANADIGCEGLTFDAARTAHLLQYISCRTNWYHSRTCIRKHHHTCTSSRGPTTFVPSSRRDLSNLRACICLKYNNNTQLL